MDPVRIAIIGSFRRYYRDVLNAIAIFEAVGCAVSSPASSWLIDADAEFVRFASDPPDCDDVEIQFRALRNILKSDAVFVVCPDGYVGRTTCYEIGRIHDRGIPLFFSHPPCDLPIPVSANAVADASTVANVLRAANGVPIVDESDLSESVRLLRDSLQQKRDRLMLARIIMSRIQPKRANFSKLSSVPVVDRDMLIPSGRC
jgi:hypothetical protein